MGIFNFDAKSKMVNNLTQNQQIEDTFFSTIDEKRKENPLIGAQLGAKDIYHSVFNTLKEPDGRLNVDNLLLWMSGLAGLSCQMTVWENVKEKRLPEEKGLYVIDTEIGQKYYMGDALNYYLLENRYSVYSLVAGIYHSWEPSKEIPELKNYVVNSVNNLGNEKYRIWGYVNPTEMTGPYKSAWDSFEKKTRRYCADSSEWPILYGMALQMAMNDAIQAISKEQCFDMVMENLLFMAKMDYGR